MDRRSNMWHDLCSISRNLRREGGKEQSTHTCDYIGARCIAHVYHTERHREMSCLVSVDAACRPAKVSTSQAKDISKYLPTLVSLFRHILAQKCRHCRNGKKHYFFSNLVEILERKREVIIGNVRHCVTIFASVLRQLCQAFSILPYFGDFKLSSYPSTRFGSRAWS